MKTFTITALVGLLLALFTTSSEAAAGLRMVGNQFAMTNTVTTVPKALTNDTALRAKAVTIRARIDRATTNSAVIYIGWTSTDDAQLFPVASDGEIVITPPDGSGGYLRLSDIYVDVGSAGDGAIVTWFNTD